MKRNLLSSLFLLILTVLSVSCMSEEQAGSRPLRIMLTEAEGLTVLSENPVLAESGENAEFTAELSEEHKIVSLSDNAQYEDGVIRPENVRYPDTVSAETEEIRKHP